ncbi:hypothetical protein CYLTODRAFT_493552, partial [Cylindrobasidium torrendii FP15055 ss-10]
MADIVITRLHISGLTPSLTADDLTKRLGSFGTVTKTEGFDKLDALGRPRPYGYVTFEATPAQLTRCRNLLSGSTWKGAKLRIADAKPDFSERLEKERQQQAEEPPKKKRKVRLGKYGATEAEDMSLVTLENAASRPGWIVTPTGRLLRPMKMRPDHPLPPQSISEPPRPKMANKKAQKALEKKEAKVRPADVRARRVAIDTRKWEGATPHLKGALLDNLVVEPLRLKPPVPSNQFPLEVETGDVSDDSGESDDDDEEEQDEQDEDEDVHTLRSPSPLFPVSRPAASRSSSPLFPARQGKRASSPFFPVKPNTISKTAIATKQAPAPPIPDGPVDLAAEAKHSLGLLASMFSGDDNEWGRGGDLDLSDVDMDTTKVGNVQPDEEDEGFEVVPVERSMTKVSKITETPANPTPKFTAPTPSTRAPTEEQGTLKAMFKPREEEARFSIAGHLGLDFEMDDDEIPGFAFDQADSATADAIPVPVEITAPALPSRPAVVFDPKAAFFFPCSSKRAGQRDVRDLAREKGWTRWAGSKGLLEGFWRVDDEAEIRKQWEEARGELTQGWKKRSKEAGKLRRRRGGGGADD